MTIYLDVQVHLMGKDVDVLHAKTLWSDLVSLASEGK